MTPRPDDGDMVAQVSFGIDDDDTAATLHHKAVKATSDLLDTILPQLKAGTAPSIPQNPDEASYYGGGGPPTERLTGPLRPREFETWCGPSRGPIRALSATWGPEMPFLVRDALDRIRMCLPGTVVSIDPLVIACETGSSQSKPDSRRKRLYVRPAAGGSHGSGGRACDLETGQRPNRLPGEKAGADSGCGRFYRQCPKRKAPSKRTVRSAWHGSAFQVRGAAYGQAGISF
jgi:hypothetical protein